MADKKRSRVEAGAFNDYLEGTTQARMRAATAFVKGRHRVPSEVNAQAATFVNELAEAEIAGEIQNLYETAKQVFGLRRRQFKRESGDGFASLATKFFHFSIFAEQHPVKPEDYVIVRRLELPGRDQSDPDHSARLDSLFGTAFDKVVVEVDGIAANYDRLVEMFEDLEEADGGRLRDEEDLRRITYVARSGAGIVVDLTLGRIELSAAGPASCSKLMALAEHYHVTISGTVELLS